MRETKRQRAARIERLASRRGRRKTKAEKRHEGACHEVQAMSEPIRSKEATAEYVRGFEASGLDKPELSRYCERCGLLPAWCECRPVSRFSGLDVLTLPEERR